MKYSIAAYFAFLAVVLAFFPRPEAAAQTTRKERDALKAADIRNQLDARHFVFRAEYVLPMRGNARPLTSDEYDLTVRKDSVVCYLPYFGRAFSATLNPIDVGLKFTTTNFTYSSTAGRKGERNIIIRPGDNRDVAQLSLTIQDNGNAYLQISSNNRDPVSYTGYIILGKEAAAR